MVALLGADQMITIQGEIEPAAQPQRQPEELPEAGL